MWEKYTKGPGARPYSKEWSADIENVVDNTGDYRWVNILRQGQPIENYILLFMPVLHSSETYIYSNGW